MKKLILLTMTFFLSLAFSPSQLTAKSLNEPTSTSVEKEAGKIRAEVLLKRLFQIKEMDVSTLNSPEKRALKKEVRSIRDELKTLDGGLYISFGAIIIILLLIILL